MQNRFNMFGLSVASLAVLLVFNGANAADYGRAAYNTNRANRSGMNAAQRMPTTPTVSINTLGNMTGGMPSQPTPNPNPNPDPDPTPDPDPVPDKCPDGGVANSLYGIEDCMRDVYDCVNGGALPNRINDLFNEDLRNSIVNGMGLCSVQVDNCIAQVRRNCNAIYHSSADVWIDFNTRRVQPEYYNFVLRKTGLTPRQAENTCLLLDKNTYGKSFDAVANSGVTTYEYNNQVGAYNGQGGSNITKANPQGAQLNDGNNGVDGGRGYYARWDATTAECYIRVGAYNKDTPIKNSWLFGAVGDDRLAEAWTPAGTTFSCNKDTFGFSLYNDTRTVAVVGVGGGTLLGAGIGAAVGHNDREFSCSIPEHREKLFKVLKEKRDIGNITRFFENRGLVFKASDNALTPEQCNVIVDLYDLHHQLDSALQSCNKNYMSWRDLNITLTCENADPNNWQDCKGKLATSVSDYTEYSDVNPKMLCANSETAEQCKELVGKKILGKLRIDPVTGSPKECKFKSIDYAFIHGDGITCDSCNGPECTCKTAAEIQPEVRALGSALSGLDDVFKTDKNNRGKTALIGAAVGAGAGGLATAITAFVEKNNINCRLGDGLDQISYGKSMSVGSLRDFYVKWNLHLPESVAPTAMVVDCDSWRRACSELTDLDQCKSAQINYKPATASAIQLIYSACKPSGSVCIENYPVAVSYGACK